MYEQVFRPIKLGGAEIPNRIARSANATNLTRGRIDDTLIEYTRLRAEAGVGLLVLGNAAVQLSASFSPFNVYDDAIIDGYKRLMDAVGPTGAGVLQQLWHPGSNVPPPSGAPPLSASDIPSPRIGMVPIPMSKQQIQEVVEAFAAGARRCEKGGITGIEIHGAHGYLFQQFLSPRTNRREDEYGGSVENRMRFTIEVLSAIRAAVSPKFAIGMRISPQGFPGGLTGEDLVPLVQTLEKKGLADFFNLSFGAYFRMDKILGPMHEPPGYQLAANAPLLEATSVPKIVNGRFRTLAEIEHVLTTTKADMVGMTRALIADGELVRKSRGGHEDRVRPCIACNEGCISGLSTVDLMSCSVNPLVQTPFERELPKARVARRILVVGGGPAGMEAARTAALRGHDVILAEAQDRLGGVVQIARRAPYRGLLGEFVDWQERELRRTAVDLRLNTRVTGEMLAALRPDALILATGSSPRRDGYQYRLPKAKVEGVEQRHVITSWQALSDTPKVAGTRAVVVDDVGHHEAADVAEHLLARGFQVTFLTVFEQFAPLLAPNMSAEPTQDRLEKNGVKIHTRVLLDGIGADNVTVRSRSTDKLFLVPADLVVLVSPNKSERSLLTSTTALPQDVRIVGDANSPRFLNRAIAEGSQAGLDV